MNIQILDSFLREHIKTKAQPNEISKMLSLSSVSVEKIEKSGDDFLYDIEVTTNRVDLMSVTGIARELSTVLNQNGIKAKFIEKKQIPIKTGTNNLLDIKIDKTLVNRVSAVIMDVKVGTSPKFMIDRLEKSGIRSLNNLIDITNYIMREMGHPAHVFDYDKLDGKKITIRKSKKGERITTLDGKTHTLHGADIVAVDANERIIDLLGIMGLENSVVTDSTKRIVLFFDNNNSKMIRKTSMGLGMRTEAAVLNEKNIDPELITPTMQRGIELYEKYASGKIIGNIIDIYPNKPKEKVVKVRKKRISQIIGVEIDDKTIIQILQNLSFRVKSSKDNIEVIPPSFRLKDINIEEDVIEEIARIYGYHKIPNILPNINNKKASSVKGSSFYWENKIKDAMKYWGFNEVYTYSMVSENLFEGPLDSAVKISNPLSQDHEYMRVTLIPSLLEIVQNNYQDSISIFEIANVYIKRKGNLPLEKLHFAGILKKQSKDIFFELKGILETLFTDIGISKYSFKKRSEGGAGADVYIDNKQIGNIELLEDDVVNFEIDFADLIETATNERVFQPIAQYPPVIEDIRVEVKNEISFSKIVETIMAQSPLIITAEMIDEYENKKTFRITYRDSKKNLSNEDITPIREKVIKALETKLHAKVG